MDLLLTKLPERYLNLALAEGLVELTLPDEPTSRRQTYRITAAGRARLAALRDREEQRP